ncbi:putative G-protein coupled receptor CG31760 isoform X1 [Vespula maculifrons]|uniref:G-protein coupled receptor CG31760 isoform X1 n=1 Tax=Vespula maculifrons TaxID=7453 RepID=A0ABD2CZU0_VESMC
MGKSWLLALFPATMTTMTTMTMMAYVTMAGAGTTSTPSFFTTTTTTTTTTTITTVMDSKFEKKKPDIEEALDVIEAASSGSLGEECASTAGFKSLPAGASLDPRRYDTARQKADMTAMMLQNLGPSGVARHNGLLDVLAKSLLLSVNDAVEARVIALNASTGTVINAVWLKRSPGSVGEPIEVEGHALQAGSRPDPGLPWFENAGASSGLRSPKFMQSPPIESYRGWWTIPYFSCKTRQWLISYSVNVRPPDSRHGVREFLSMDIDISGLEVNQCNASPYGDSASSSNQIASFRGTHKCQDDTTQCEYHSPNGKINEHGVGAGWAKGAYVCKCRQGFYGTNLQRTGFDGILVEAAWKEMQENISDSYVKTFRCLRCAPGCAKCKGPEPCLATYHWPFRITLLAFSIFCVFGTVVLVAYMYQHRKLKVFKVASPIFLSITLLGCAIMYLEMAAIFPVLDMYSCIATKWTRHLGFCISYTALLMKTWRVSLTYRVKSAHKVKLTDKQLLQWMVPILLVMLIYLGTWTLSAPPYAEVIADNYGLKFYQCSFNWWDHSLAIGDSGPSRTRRSMGQPGASSRRHREFLAKRNRLGARRNDRSLSGERGTEGPDLSSISRRIISQIQKLAAQIEFMKIVHMEMHNRHIKPKVGGYFSAHGHTHGHPSAAQSPIAKSSTASFILKSAVERGASAAAAAAVEDSTFPSGSLHRARRMEMLRERKAGKEREKEKEKEKAREKGREKEKVAAQQQEAEQRELPHSSCEKV